MPDIIGHKLLDAEGNVVQTFGGVRGQFTSPPNPLVLPNGDHVHAPALDTDYSGFRLVLWEADPLTLEEQRAEKRAALANKRWEKETGGTTFNGMPLATDAVSQTKYIGAVVGAQINPQGTMKWKTGNGFVTLDAAAVTAVAMAVRAHVQACFDNEADLAVLIDAAETAEELDAIDINAGWPA